jgi:transposase
MIQRPSKAYDPEAHFLLPPSMRDWLPENHLVWFILDLIKTLDLRVFEHCFRSRRGHPHYPIPLMIALLLYAYCTGHASSRVIERKTYEDLAFRVLAGNLHPDHDTICRFRRRHHAAFFQLFTQVLAIARELSLSSLGEVSLDGTKMKANASKHKAMSYERMKAKEQVLETIVADLLHQAETVDQQEDQRYGKGKQRFTLPQELGYQQQRLQKIRHAREALEAEALQKALLQASNSPESLKIEPAIPLVEAPPRQEETSLEDDQDSLFPPSSPLIQAASEVATEATPETRTNAPCPGETPPPAEAPLSSETLPRQGDRLPDPSTQRNFTDPESRIMHDSAQKTFIQGYNAQLAVEGKHQFILAAAITQKGNDRKQLQPMLQLIQQQCGSYPEKLLADAGYFSESNVHAAMEVGVDPFIAPGKMRHDDPTSLDKPARKETSETFKETPSLSSGRKKQASNSSRIAQQMREKLQSETGQEVYRHRKSVVEPVFGCIKQARNFRQFLLRGVTGVSLEWQLIALTHNLLRLYRILGSFEMKLSSELTQYREVSCT